MHIKNLLLIFFIFSFSLQSIANPVQWENQYRKSIRSKIYQCNVYFAPADIQVKNNLYISDDNSGVVLLEDFPIAEQKVQFKKTLKQSIKTALLQEGEELLRDGVLYITGIEYKNKKQILLWSQESLKELSLEQSNIKIQILEFSKNQVLENIKKYQFLPAMQNMLEQLQDFLPSKHKDYQRPLLSEFKTKMGTTAMIEASLISFLFTSLPPADAIATATIHISLLTTFIILNRSISNWVLRSKSALETFLKASLTSLPFVSNFNIFGNFSKILKSYQEKGIDYLWAQFPNEILQFAQTQSFTILLQTWFYQSFYFKGTQAWSWKQNDPIYAKHSRSFVTLIEVPILSLDAVSLAMAGANHYPLFQMGNFSANLGHMSLMALIAAGYLVQKNHKLLDKAFSIYLKWALSRNAKI